MADYTFTYDREMFENQELKAAEIMDLIAKHKEVLYQKIKTNLDYYEGKHDILERSRPESVPNTKAVCNHAKDIADTASGYFLGTPIAYKAKDDSDISALLDMLAEATAGDDDVNNALMLSITGRAYEYIYAAEDAAILKIEPISPLNTFIVCDQSIEHNELFSVYWYQKKNDVADETDAAYSVTICTANDIKEMSIKGQEFASEIKTTPHNFGAIPVVEYKNNHFAIGDFEQQIGLIDAYNALTSDRVNDIEQFVDAVLVLYGSIMGDSEDEVAEAMKALRQKKLLELSPDSRAEWLTRSLDEGGTEILRNAIKEDIYTFSHVPCLTDVNFAGNSSGVAMEYKLMGLEMLTKTKENWYRRGLAKRLKIFCEYISKKGKAIDPKNVEIVFSRGLPKNILEISQVVGNLAGMVSNETLLSLLPFVQSPQDELEKVKQQQEEAMAQQQQMMAMTQNMPIPSEEPEEEEEPIDEE